MLLDRQLNESDITNIRKGEITMRAYMNSNHNPWRMFDELTGTFPYDWLNLALREQKDPYPRVTARENEQGLLLEAEVPGIGPEALDVSVDDNILTIKGEKVQADGTKQPFERTFTIPMRLQPEKMTATIKHGLLTVNIPKREEAKPRRIEITAA
jgi:HSP20 family protein